MTTYPASEVDPLIQDLTSQLEAALLVAQDATEKLAAVRAEVVAGVRQGKTDAQIVAGLRARYGTAVDLTPTGGLSTILWIIPAIFALAVLFAVVLAVRRRRSEAS